MFLIPSNHVGSHFLFDSLRGTANYCVWGSQCGVCVSVSQQQTSIAIAIAIGSRRLCRPCFRLAIETGSRRLCQPCFRLAIGTGSRRLCRPYFRLAIGTGSRRLGHPSFAAVFVSLYREACLARSACVCRKFAKHPQAICVIALNCWLLLCVARVRDPGETRN
jgi:hypothetical protein